MSASEKLRALDVAMTAGPWWTREGRMLGMPTRAPGERFTVTFLDRENAEATAAVRNALPLIADVIETAENPNALRGDLDRALTALQAHLTPEHVYS